MPMNSKRHHWKFALITPSYAPDFERCQLLVESVERCLHDDTQHYVIVDRRDLSLFRQLKTPKTDLLVAEDLLPSWIFRLPGIQKLWISYRTLPIRNWILQQLIKIAACDVLHEDVLTFCDSDNTFIRPFDMPSQLVRNNQLALLRVNFQNRDVHRWIAASKKLLGISGLDIPPVTYVSNMICWHRSNILKLRHHIEEVHGMHWIQAICQHFSVSEYILYGIFVEHLLGIESAKHFIFDTELIKPSWNHSLDSPTKINHFLGQLKESHIGVMIHSKDQVPIHFYRDQIKALWV